LAVAGWRVSRGGCPAKRHPAGAHLTIRSSGPPASFRIFSGRGRRPLSSGVRWAWEAVSGLQGFLASGTVLACCLLLSRQAVHAALIVGFGGVLGFGVGFNAAWSAGRSWRLQGGGLRGLWCPAKQGLAGAHLTVRSSGPPASFRVCSGRGRRPLSSGVRWAWEAGSGWQRLPSSGTVLRVACFCPGRRPTRR